jgi:hypothetical protein
LFDHLKKKDYIMSIYGKRLGGPGSPKPGGKEPGGKKPGNKKIGIITRESLSLNDVIVIKNKDDRIEPLPKEPPSLPDNGWNAETFEKIKNLGRYNSPVIESVKRLDAICTGFFENKCISELREDMQVEMNTLKSLLGITDL